MLKHFKEEYFSKNIQFVLTDLDGLVLESDQTLFVLKIGQPLEEFHPFFTCIISAQETDQEVVFFNCVQLGLQAMERIVDIEMQIKSDTILVMVHDLTEHYVSYQAIAQARNQSIINSELVVLKNLELQEREKFKNQFIRNFSHELRNPLTSIISITNIIQNTGLTDEQKEMINFLRASNSNLKLMLEDILSIGLISSGKLHLNPTVFSLTELLELINFTYIAKAKEKELEFRLVADSKIPEFAEGDRLRLYQVLTNLLDNAIKYTNEGSVQLVVNLNQKWANRISLRFEVSDTGNGIPKERTQDIFESFSKLESNTEKGTGLGLPIVKGLLELMGSKIKVDSDLGRGAVFHFNIVLKSPLHPVIDSNTKKLSKEITKKTKSKNSTKYKVLLVEDDEQVQMLLFKTLLSAKCFHIDFESDGAKVMEAILQNSYDLILMDVMLPNVNGDHLTRLIREFPFKNIKKIPILGLTANAYADDIEMYKKSGMNSLVTKPFDADELLGTIFDLLKIK